jgi:hypothetical protein
LRPELDRQIIPAMPDPLSPFRNSLLPVDAPLAPHANPAAGILMGRGGPVRLTLDGVAVEGDMLLIRPGVVHAIGLPARGADILYLDGLAFPFDVPLARALDGKLAELAGMVLDGTSDAADELRARLTAPATLPPPRVADVVRAIYADPMRHAAGRTCAAARHGTDAGATTVQGSDRAELP